MSFNKIIIVGNLGRDPELRYTPQGVAVCNLSLATNERKRDKSGEMQEVTTWFRVTLWRNQAENAAKYLTKGSPVYVEGRLGVEEYTDRDGNNRFSLEVQGTDMHFISAGSGTRNEEFSGAGSSPAAEFAGPADRSTGAATAAAPSGDDDIPF
ncbi:MAG TPA: single-stranded DNA-binding protein [Pyrinomonadaceae bacterium]|nr:single-stranded DNA-binding protein [Pyrinomonadaceae bacterium]